MVPGGDAGAPVPRTPAAPPRFWVDSQLGASFGLGDRGSQLATVVAPSVALVAGTRFALQLPLQLLAAPRRVTFVAPLAVRYELPLRGALALSLRAGGGYAWEQGEGGSARGAALLGDAGLVWTPRPGVRVGAEPLSVLRFFGERAATMLRVFLWFGVDAR